MMNERIKELIKQAQVNDLAIDTNGDPYDVKRLDPEKFAELIVAECMTTVLKESKWYWDKDEFESSNAIQNAARRLTEHFGVEDRAIPILSADEQALFAGIASSKLFTIEGAKKQFGVEE